MDGGNKTNEWTMKKRSDVTHKLDARHSSLDPCLPLGPVSSPAIKHKRMTLDAVKKNCLDNGHLMMRARRRQSDSHTHRHIFPVGAREREGGGSRCSSSRSWVCLFTAQCPNERKRLVKLANCELCCWHIVLSHDHQLPPAPSVRMYISLPPLHLLAFPSLLSA